MSTQFTFTKSLGNDFRPGTDYPAHPVHREPISLDAVINNVNLGNGQEYYEHGYPDFKIIRNAFGDLKLTFDEDSIENWSLDEPNVNELRNEYFHLIYDNDGTPIGVKLYEAEGPDWMYFMELEDSNHPHDSDTEGDALYGMARKSSNPEEKNDGQPPALTGEFLGPGVERNEEKRELKKSHEKEEKSVKRKQKRDVKKERERKEKLVVNLNFFYYYFYK